MLRRVVDRLRSRSVASQFAPEKAAEFYAEHKGKGFYDGLVRFMSRCDPRWGIAVGAPAPSQLRGRWPIRFIMRRN